MNELRVLVTGGAGFIGSNFVRYLLRPPIVNQREVRIVNYDKLTYAGNLDNVEDLFPVLYKGKFYSEYNHFFVRGDLIDRRLLAEVFREFRPHLVFNFAAESHVDRSIGSAMEFVRSNIRGMVVLLEVMTDYPATRLIQISTDEVLGSLGMDGQFHEDTPINPQNSYSVSKAAAEHFCRAFINMHGLDIVITRSPNNYGPRQYPEKLIPVIITHALQDMDIPVYGDGQQIRDWIYVEDHCDVLWEISQRGKSGNTYHVGSTSERTNLWIVKTILDYLHKPHSLIKYVEDRPGHDWRYSMNWDRIYNELGWCPQVTLDDGLRKTIDWYMQNRSWWEKIIGAKQGGGHGSGRSW